MNYSKTSFDSLKASLIQNTKSGIDFIFAASFIWLAITYIWTLEGSASNKSVTTLMIGGAMLPLALLLSKIFKTQWKIKDNPLQPLGLWLNIAQLIYFPLLIFTLWKSPDYFIMAYAIITGAHLFPYAWLYDSKAYAIVAIMISVGALTIALTMRTLMFLVPAMTTCALLTLAIRLSLKHRLGKSTVQVA